MKNMKHESFTYSRVYVLLSLMVNTYLQSLLFVHDKMLLIFVAIDITIICNITHRHKLIVLLWFITAAFEVAKSPQNESSRMISKHIVE